jgi:hypothetical protein
LGVTTFGFADVGAQIDRMAALQEFSVVGDKDVDAIVEITKNGEAERLTHAWDSGTTRHHAAKESGEIVPSHEC